MKEVTYEDWVKNLTPREMWIWNDDIVNKIKRKVIYMLEDVTHPVVSLDVLEQGIILRKHCAEIQEPRRMTNQELDWWLREGKHREYINRTGGYVHFEYVYLPCDADEYVSKDILIRKDGGEWREPLVEVEE